MNGKLKFFQVVERGPGFGSKLGIVGDLRGSEAGAANTNEAADCGR
jgi:hypothetical protein